MGTSEVRDLSEFLRSVEVLLSGVCSAPTQNEVDFASKRARERATKVVALLSQVPGGLMDLLEIDQDSIEEPEPDFPKSGIFV